MRNHGPKLPPPPKPTPEAIETERQAALRQAGRHHHQHFASWKELQPSPSLVAEKCKHCERTFTVRQLATGELESEGDALRELCRRSR